MRNTLEFDEKHVWQVVILLTAIGSYIFLKPFLGVVIFTALVAFVCNPVYKWLLKVFKNRTGIASFGALLTSIFAFLIPLAVIIIITIGQIASLFTQIRESDFGQEGITTTRVFEATAERINNLAQATGNNFTIHPESIQGIVTDRVPGIVSAAVDQTIETAGSIPRFVSYAILYCFLFVAFLSKQKKIITTLRKLSPFSKNVTNMYLHKAGSMTVAMTKGQFLIALVAGTLSALALLFVGINYFFFFLLFLTFLSFIPLGAGIITMPIGVVMAINGDIWQGVFLVAFHLIVVTNIDNFLRPRLVPKDAHLPPALTLLATFAGVYYFGLLGVVYGPVIMVIIITTISTYQRVKAGEHLTESSKKKLQSTVL